MSGLQTNIATRPPSGLTAAAVHTKHGLLKRSESSVLFYMELDGCFGTASPGGHTRDVLFDPTDLAKCPKFGIVLAHLQ